MTADFQASGRIHSTVQQMLRAEPIEGSQVGQLTAEGPQQSLVSDLVNAVALAYRQQVLDGFLDRVTTTYEDAEPLFREEVWET